MEKTVFARIINRGKMSTKTTILVRIKNYVWASVKIVFAKIIYCKEGE
jgi:hypothetical protein